ncbi:MAG: GntR family transcriptional regulator, partial [Desulfomonilia bacterium]|nr:GntR family transcriptional regulator [Desulfomonilia bacterium]
MIHEALSRGEGIPLYLQIRDYLRGQITSGALKERRLPPVRVMAQRFKVNPNTVHRAYQELKREGMILPAVGRGTFVSTDVKGLQRETRAILLRKAIERAVEESLSLEFTLEEFEEATRTYVREKKEFMKKLSLVFIECNIEQLTYFTEHLDLDPHLKRFPVLLQDLRNRDKQVMRLIQRSDIVVTSFYHLDEVHQRLASLEMPIIGINLEPEMKTLIDIAKIPAHSTVGIVTTSDQFRKEIRGILHHAGIQFASLLETSSDDPR